MTRAPLSFLLLTAIVALGMAASLVANWPGHFPPDALWQLAQGRSGEFNSWHPPVMAWLLGLADRLSPDAAAFIGLDAVLGYGGLLALLALEPRPRPLGLALVALLMASPALLVVQGMVVKDVLFADTALAGFAALAWAEASGDRRVVRAALLALAATLLALAVLTRQNGLVVAPCAAAALTAMVWPRGWPQAVAQGAVFLTLIGLVAGAGALALRAHGDGQPEAANELKRLQVYDLAGAVRLDPGLPLPLLSRQAPDVERFVRQDAAPHYMATGADNLETLPGGEQLIPDTNAVGPQWLALILHHPWLYARVRTGVFMATLQARAAQGCPTFFVGVDRGQPDLLQAAGLKARYTAKDRWDNQYAGAFRSGPVFSHLAYGAVLMLCMALAARDLARGESRARPVALLALGAAVLLAALSFFVVSSACDFRYLYPLDLAAMAAAASQATRRPVTSHPTLKPTA